MRFLCTIPLQDLAKQFSHFLTAEKIDNMLDTSTNHDWGSPQYGEIQWNIWIIDEDQITKANELWQAFQQDPEDPRFFIKEGQIPSLITRPTPPPPPKRKSTAFRFKPGQKTQGKVLGWITFYLLMLCSLIFALSQMTAPAREPIAKQFAYPSLSASPIKKLFFYDYPHTFEILDKLVNAYGLDKLQTPTQLPSDGQYLLKNFLQTPFWEGFYPIALAYFQEKPIPWTKNTSLFEKLREGEVWRLFTPCLLHNDILHLAFNLIWLVVIGRQMEMKISMGKYLFFIILTGVFSNTAQYLMSGSNFIGLSGVLCAMITFVWVRQKKAPWEGYQLLPSTMAFIAIFVIGMFVLSATSFFLEILADTSIASGIANTAHLSGAFIGAIFGLTPLFKRNK